MRNKMFQLRFRHPLYERILELELPAATTFGEILKILYTNKFLQKKPADYAFIIDQQLCALNKTLASYIPPETSGIVEVQINGLLTIMS
jgi:hypothetical protein